MKFILTQEKFNLKEESKIKDDIISKVKDVLLKYNAFDINSSESIKLPQFPTLDEKDFKMVLGIDFKLLSNGKMNYELEKEVKNISNEYINNIYFSYRQGGIKTKTDKGIVDSYTALIELKGLNFDQDVVDKQIKSNKERMLNTLYKSGVLSFIDRYNIKSFDEFINVITISTRDINKYAKITDKDVKKKAYQIKDWVLKILFKEGYIEGIRRHRIDGGLFGLVYTKVKHKDSLDGKISFHIPPQRLEKFGLDLNDYPEEEREYVKRESSIDNEERMLDFMNIIDSNFVSQHFLGYLKKYFNGILT